jgi:amino acid permease
MKKEVKEMKTLSHILFGCILLFMLMLFLQLLSVGTKTFSLGNANANDPHKPESWTIDQSINFWDVLGPPDDVDWKAYLATSNKINFSFSVSMILFPIYSNLKNKNN